MFSCNSEKVFKKATQYNYFSPNVYGYLENHINFTITFHTIRYVGADSIIGQTIFFLGGAIKKISPYEKQYLK